jgi:hypothetical protein
MIKATIEDAVAFVSMGLFTACLIVWAGIATGA